MDYFNRITGLTWGRSGDIARALAKCRPHDADPEVLETDDPEGLVALLDKNVKAVIWHRTLPRKLVKALNRMTNEHIHSLSETPGMDEDGLYNLEKDDKYPSALRKDIAKLHSIVERISPIFARHATATFIGRIGYSGTTHGLHSDDDGDGFTLHATYLNPGMEWFPGQFTFDDYDELSAITHSSQYPPGLRSEFTKAGDVIIFKGQNTNHKVPYRFLKGLLHRTPDAELGSEDGITPAPATERDRLIFTMY